MPNHILNIMSIRGSEETMKSLVPKILQMEDGERVLTFEPLVPMPPELKATTSPYQLVDTQKEADERNAGFKGMNGETMRVISIDELKRRVETYGATDWYEWANKYWGTKWGAYRSAVIRESTTEILIKFETAWHAPIPWYEAVEREGVRVDYAYYDEDFGSNCGESSSVNRDLNELKALAMWRFFQEGGLEEFYARDEEEGAS